MQHSSDSGAHIIATSDTADKFQFRFYRYLEVPSFSCHPYLNFSSAHMPAFLVVVLSVLIKRGECFRSIFWAKFLRHLIFSSAKIPSLFLKCFWHIRDLLFGILHGSSQKRQSQTGQWHCIPLRCHLTDPPSFCKDPHDKARLNILCQDPKSGLQRLCCHVRGTTLTNSRN